MKKFYLLVLIAALIPIKAMALSDIDGSCSQLGTDYSFIGSGHEIYQIFVPETGILDAVSVRVKTEIGNSSTLLVEVYDATNSPVRKIAEGTKTIGTEIEWAHIDFDDVETPLGMYAIKAKTIDQNAHGIWYYSGNNCYDRGYAVLDDQARVDLDMNFATYGYNSSSGSNPAPAANNDTPDQDVNDQTKNITDSSDSLNSSNSTDESGTASSSSSIKKSNPISKEETDRIVRDLQSQSEQDSDRSGMLKFIFAQAIIPILLFGGLFFIGIVGVIILIIFRKKKSANPNPPPPEIKKEQPRPQDVRVEAPAQTTKPSKHPKAGFVIFIIFLVLFLLLVIVAGGYYGYKKIFKAPKNVPSSTATVAKTAISTGTKLAEESEFGPVIKGVVGDITLKYNTEIPGGRHIFYVPSQDLTDEDYDKIKSALIEKGYEEFQDTTFKGEKSLTFVKDENFIRIGKNPKFISITVVKKKEDLKNRAK